MTEAVIRPHIEDKNLLFEGLPVELERPRDLLPRESMQLRAIPVLERLVSVLRDHREQWRLDGGHRTLRAVSGRHRGDYRTAKEGVQRVLSAASRSRGHRRRHGCQW